MKFASVPLDDKLYSELLARAEREGDTDIVRYMRDALRFYTLNAEQIAVPQVVALEDLTNDERSMAGIYIARHREVRRYYVGSTHNIARRISRHITHLRSKTHHNVALQYDWSCDSNAFRWGVLDLMPDASVVELRQREYMWIRRIEKRHGEQSLYNILREGA